MAFLSRRGRKAIARQQPSAIRCGCGRGKPADRMHCGSCARENRKGGAKAAPFECRAQVWRDGRKQACGMTVRNGQCPSPDH